MTISCKTKLCQNDPNLAKKARVRSAVREVVDNVHRGKSAFKETVEASVDEGTSERKK